MPGHDLLRCYFQCDGECVTVEHFRKSLMRKDDVQVDHVGGLLAETDVWRLALNGCRVDHVGGLTAQTDVRRLALHTNNASCKQGGAQKRMLRQTGKGALLQNRLQRRVLKRPTKTKKLRCLSPHL